MSIKLDALKGHVPDAILNELKTIAEKFGIVTNLRLAHFLSQCAHESGNFKVVKENLNYGAQGLANTFPSRFAKDPKAKVKVPNATALQIERKPEMIANNVYANRMGNGDVSSGEGFKFRGRGYIQLTGKDNYKLFESAIGDKILENPELVATKYPLASAAFFFNRNKLWEVCDKGTSKEVVTALTKRINGGTIGLEDRYKHFLEYLALLK